MSKQDDQDRRPRPHGVTPEPMPYFDHLALVSDPAFPAPVQTDAGAPLGPSRTDVQGSYTGLPMDPNEAPVQDADDL